MRWQRARRSENIENGGGGGGFRLGGKGLSLGGIAVVVILGLLSGQDPMQILGNVGRQVLEQGATGSNVPAQPSAANQQNRDFVSAVLGDTEDTWRQIFQSAGQAYQDPKLVLFAGQVNSACGAASSAVGPFYCPGDRKVYLDTGFFREMETQFQAAGDFAKAYVIAHEVGHHVQTLLGVSAKVNAARQRGERVEGDNGLLVRQELQADCLAGIWAHHAQRRLAWMDEGDLESALGAANAIGDDRLQKQSRGQVVPDSFTHGTSAQRVKWFRVGFDSGEIGRCDTFATARL
jgi:predicted metalloprotease